MATHPSILAWEIPWTEEPGGLQSVCSRRARRDRKTYTLTFHPQIAPFQHAPHNWCPGMTQRDGMGREVGGGIGTGSTCQSMADSCQCMAETTTIL